ncbi:hypothetical protein B5E41_30350 [Rhizobium esperanzae]|uniref:DNA-binding protein n=1 Tax=Rhizobium esperanzae TaxID=1967781 RepID=A0A246DN22_9HYPH|nr:hypothetical protein [Rhizobium esperanzae]OWO89546.1 hypothetical protein B5E41_30350 [Rhizobium esperanzae]
MIDAPLTVAEAAAILECETDLVQCALDKGKLPSLQLAHVRAFRDRQAETFDDLFVEVNAWDHEIEFVTLH